MDIVILNYPTTTVETLRNVETFFNFEFSDSVENFLELQGYNLHDIHYMCIEAPLEEIQPLARFYKNERVFVCTYGTDHGWGIVDKETEVFTYSDKVRVILDNGQSVEERGVCIYRLTRDVCPNCGRLLCAEVDTESGYSHYCPSCDENYYESEIIESV